MRQSQHGANVVLCVPYDIYLKVHFGENYIGRPLAETGGGADRGDIAEK